MANRTTHNLIRVVKPEAVPLTTKDLVHGPIVIVEHHQLVYCHFLPTHDMVTDASRPILVALAQVIEHHQLYEANEASGPATIALRPVRTRRLLRKKTNNGIIGSSRTASCTKYGADG